MPAVKPTQDEIRAILGEDAFAVWEAVRYFILDHYNMDVSWDEGGKYGVYECKFRKSGKTLCALYIKDNELVALVIFGKGEREKFEAERRDFSPQLQQIYDTAKTYHDGKWMYIKLRDSYLVPDITRMLYIKKKPNRWVTMCGYICDMCKAYAGNIKKQDEREILSALWGKYYGLDIPAEAIYCDGCRRTKKDARRIDNNCPVRACVLKTKVDNCSECNKYPCDVFSERKGLSCAEARQELGDLFNEEEYEEYMLAYDNKTRLDRRR